MWDKLMHQYLPYASITAVSRKNKAGMYMSCKCTIYLYSIAGLLVLTSMEGKAAVLRYSRHHCIIMQISWNMSTGGTVKCLLTRFCSEKKQDCDSNPFGPAQTTLPQFTFLFAFTDLRPSPRCFKIFAVLLSQVPEVPVPVFFQLQQIIHCRKRWWLGERKKAKSSHL